MQVFPGVANLVVADLVKVADGLAVTAGTVTFYLKALSGGTGITGHWYKGADGTWSDTKVSAHATGVDSTADADGHWSVLIEAAAWVAGRRYSLYARESGGLDISVADNSVLCETTPSGGGSVTGTITITEGGVAVDGAECRVSTDSAGTLVVWGPVVSGSTGIISVSLDPGTYYLLAPQLGGHNVNDGFTYPRQFTVSVAGGFVWA
jgi:hypothetical protein